MKLQTKIHRVLSAVVDENCRTASEVAIEVGWSPRIVSAQLHKLSQMGLVYRCGTYPSVAGESEWAMYEPTPAGCEIPPFDHNEASECIDMEALAREYNEGGGTYDDVAAMFNVSPSTVGKAVRMARKAA